MPSYTWEEARDPIRRRNTEFCYDAEEATNGNGAIKPLMFVTETLVYEDGSPYYGDPRKAGRKVFVTYYVRPVGYKRAVLKSDSLHEAKQLAEKWLSEHQEHGRDSVLKGW